MRPGPPPFIERFNGSMREELLNREVLHSLTEARVVIGHWVEHYNNERPHSGLQMRTPGPRGVHCDPAVTLDGTL